MNLNLLFCCFRIIATYSPSTLTALPSKFLASSCAVYVSLATLWLVSSNYSPLTPSLHTMYSISATYPTISLELSEARRRALKGSLQSMIKDCSAKLEPRGHETQTVWPYMRNGGVRGLYRFSHSVPESERAQISANRTAFHRWGGGLESVDELETIENELTNWHSSAVPNIEWKYVIIYLRPRWNDVDCRCGCNYC